MPRAFVEIAFTDLLRIVDELSARERLALMRHLGVDLPAPDELESPIVGRPSAPPIPHDDGDRTGEISIADVEAELNRRR